MFNHSRKQSATTRGFDPQPEMCTYICIHTRTHTFTDVCRRPSACICAFTRKMHMEHLAAARSPFNKQRLFFVAIPGLQTRSLHQHATSSMLLGKYKQRFTDTVITHELTHCVYVLVHVLLIRRFCVGWQIFQIGRRNCQRCSERDSCQWRGSLLSTG